MSLVSPGGLWYKSSHEEDETDHRRGSGRTSEVTTQHEIEDKETILIVLERVSQVDDKRMVDLHGTTHHLDSVTPS